MLIVKRFAFVVYCKIPKVHIYFLRVVSCQVDVAFQALVIRLVTLNFFNFLTGIAYSSCLCIYTELDSAMLAAVDYFRFMTFPVIT